MIVVGNGAPEFSEALKRTRPGQMILDLVRVKTNRDEIPGQYQGICWALASGFGRKSPVR